MSSPRASAARRRVPSPCWAREETLALIYAYRDRWFSLSRGNLRASDWEAVAADLASAGATDGPPKTSIQCRHKIEKLRKRYRAEKQRALSKPGRFFSSWDLFPVLDSMEIGIVGSVQDKNIEKAVKSGNIGSNRNPNFEIGREFMLPGLMAKGEPTLAYDCNYGGGFGVKSRDDGLPLPSWFSRHSRASPYFDDSDDEDEDDDIRCGFPVKLLGDRNLMPLAARSVPYGKIDSDGNCKPSIHGDYDTKSDVEEGLGFGKRIAGDWKSGLSGFRSNSYYKKDGNTRSLMNHGVWNGSSCSKRPGFVKKSNGGVKRGRDAAVSELVSSIKKLGEVFVKMEKMKMETAREMEKMRMETEMKHNQMILESQQQVVNAFAEAFVEETQKKKKKKKKVKTLSGNYGDL